MKKRTASKTTRYPCEFCDGKVEPRIIRAEFHYQREIIFIDGVPAWVCANCGEQYFDALVYKQMEKIAEARHLIRKIVSFPLAEFQPVA
ncbi:MAG: YgiT-type zinc finger protein [Chloroflexi bacterium]|nr:YgiT-type zinc finger protein [Chloroflexota bacterium]MBI3742422.1 YgiT-type zinc finger protein [Chloroflexota bacterium]